MFKTSPKCRPMRSLFIIFIFVDLFLYKSLLNVILPNLGLHERDLLRACLTFTSLQKINDLEYLSPTEELIFLMISHLGPASTFLEPDINAMLAERVRVFFIGNPKTIFKLDEPHNGNYSRF